MTTDIRCPECGGATVAEAADGRRHCPQCGATLAYRTQWLPLLGVALALSALLGLGSALFFEGKAAFLIGPLAVLTVIFTSRVFRKLQKV